MRSIYARAGPVSAVIWARRPADGGEHRGQDVAIPSKEPVMRLIVEIAAAALLVFCITATSAAFSAGKPVKGADALGCSFNVPAKASPAARCAAMRRQCGGKFYANYCGDKLLSSM
jgi:hypothetical protein